MRLSERLPLTERLLVVGTLPFLLLPGRVADGAVLALLQLLGVLLALLARRLLGFLPLPARLAVFLPLLLGGGLQLLDLLGADFQLANPFLPLGVFNAMALLVLEENRARLPDAAALTTACLAAALLTGSGLVRGLSGGGSVLRQLPSWDGLLQPALLPLGLAVILLIVRRPGTRQGGRP